MEKRIKRIYNNNIITTQDKITISIKQSMATVFLQRRTVTMFMFINFSVMPLSKHTSSFLFTKLAQRDRTNKTKVCFCLDLVWMGVSVV